jgi:hypothetical protein
MENKCENCIHCWVMYSYPLEKDYVAQCTEPKSPNYNKLIKLDDVCDYFEDVNYGS